MPAPKPTSTGPIQLPCGVNKPRIRPTNSPNHAPEAAPPPSTLLQVSRPVTRSTSIRSTPTMVTS